MRRCCYYIVCCCHFKANLMLKGGKKMPSQWRQFDQPQSQTNMCTFCTSVRKRYWKPPLQRYEAPDDEVWGNLWPIASVLQTTMRFSYLLIWQLSILHSHSNASLGDFKLIWSAVRENTRSSKENISLNLIKNVPTAFKKLNIALLAGAAFRATVHNELISFLLLWRFSYFCPSHRHTKLSRYICLNGINAFIFRLL